MKARTRCHGTVETDRQMRFIQNTGFNDMLNKQVLSQDRALAVVGLFVTTATT
jgi:hypothetical protein